YHVRAFVRDEAKMPAELKDKVELFVGNVLEPDSVSDAVDGMDGVVVALGTRNSLEPTSDMSEGTKNIIESMRAKNVKPLNWVCYEPSREVTVTINPTSSPGRSISKRDLGTFLVESLSEPKYFKSVIGIANK
ncbi:hypothetical protein SFRURICE_013068, partial [Spodoptera frugiperda]